MYFDVSYTLKGAGADVVLISPKVIFSNTLFSLISQLQIILWLFTGLQLAKDLDIRQLLVRGDAQLVAKQVQKEFDCNNEKMTEYLVECSSSATPLHAPPPKISPLVKNSHARNASSELTPILAPTTSSLHQELAICPERPAPE
jgi:hypothetical protein